MRETNSRTGSLSQPEFAPLNKKSEFSDQLEIKIKEENVMSFSQPLGNVDILQSQGMPDLTQISQIESYHESPTFEGFVRRMTRLFFANELKVVVDWLVEILKSQNYFVDSCIDNK
ncbi:MAG: Serine/threonine-protein kinase Chk1, partial [Paramarteilia canceri]